MESVKFETIYGWLGNGRKTIPTLGRRTTLTFWAEKGMIIGLDTHGNKNSYSPEYWQEICDVIDKTDPEMREITTTYQHCHYFYKAPGVPALCRSFCDAHK